MDKFVVYDKGFIIPYKAVMQAAPICNSNENDYCGIGCKPERLSCRVPIGDRRKHILKQVMSERPQLSFNRIFFITVGDHYAALLR
jgi:hypothetical protein